MHLLQQSPFLHEPLFDPERFIARYYVLQTLACIPPLWDEPAKNGSYEITVGDKLRDSCSCCSGFANGLAFCYKTYARALGIGASEFLLTVEHEAFLFLLGQVELVYRAAGSYDHAMRLSVARERLTEFKRLPASECIDYLETNLPRSEFEDLAYHHGCALPYGYLREIALRIQKCGKGDYGLVMFVLDYRAEWALPVYLRRPSLPGVSRCGDNAFIAALYTNLGRPSVRQIEFSTWSGKPNSNFETFFSPGQIHPDYRALQEAARCGGSERIWARASLAYKEDYQWYDYCREDWCASRDEVVIKLILARPADDSANKKIERRFCEELALEAEHWLDNQDRMSPTYARLVEGIQPRLLAADFAKMRFRTSHSVVLKHVVKAWLTANACNSSHSLRSDSQQAVLNAAQLP